MDEDRWEDDGGATRAVQIQVRVKVRRRPQPELDLRTPSGRVLPW